MTRQGIIDKHWLEFIGFYKELMVSAKEEEVELGGDLFKMLTMDNDKLKRTAIYQEFGEPTETNFWKWYAIMKVPKKEKQS